ncbi:hypothetical protein BH23PLA1_BH23PLA1_00440 [soil metagenome]
MLFVKESKIAASPAEVFAFHESPGALQKLIPPWEKVEVVEQADSIRPGSRVVLKSTLAGMALKWVAEHVEYDPPHRFSDRQVSGPFARWEHTHQFLDDGQGGTILRDEVDYEPPMGALGRLLGAGFIRQKLERMFDYRHEATRRIFESGGEPANPNPGAEASPA